MPLPGPPTDSARRGRAAEVRIVFAFLAEIGVLGVALTAAGVYLRARELDLEEREPAPREPAAGRRL